MKSSLSVLGIGLACGILVLSGVQGDAIDFMVDVHFRLSQRQEAVLRYLRDKGRVKSPDMEEAFGFEMRGADVMKLKTLDTAVDFVAQHVGK